MSWIDGNYYGDCGKFGDFAFGKSGPSSGGPSSITGNLILLGLCVLLLWGMWKKDERDSKRYDDCLKRHTYLWCDNHYGDDGAKSNEDLNIKTMIEESERKGR